MMLRNAHTFILQSIRQITPNVRHFTFAPANHLPFAFIPGQFITILINENTRRSYSIASIPGRDTTIDIAASYVPQGIGSECLFHLKEGDNVTVTGPFGRLILRDEQPSRYILVATGTGVTPYRAMLPQLAARFSNDPNLQVVLLLGVQSQAELLYGEDFINFMQEHPGRFIFQAFYSRKQPEVPQAYEHAGYLHSGLHQLNPRPEQDIIYLCGNPAMIDQAFAWLKEQGFDSQQIRREKYVSAK